MPVTAVDLTRRLETGLPDIVLVFGDEPLLVEETCDHVRHRALELGYEERLVLNVEPGFNWGRVSDAVNSLSLFSQKRLIDLRLPTGKPGDAGSQAIVGFCESPPGDTTLLIVCGRLEARIKQSKWCKAIGRAGAIVEHKSVPPAQFPAWINTRVGSVGMKIEQDATALLAHFTEGNLLAAAQEIDKLKLMPASKNIISYDDVSNSITDNARFNVFSLVDLCLAGNTNRALRTLNGLQREGVEPILIVWALAKQVRTLYRLAAGLEAGKKKAQLFKEFRVWYKQEQLVSSALSRHRRQDWALMLKDVARLDRLVKGRGEGNVWQALERTCLVLCGLKISRQFVE